MKLDAEMVKRVAWKLMNEGDLSDAERLAVAQFLIQDVVSRLEPMENSVTCVAEGYLSAAAHALEEGTKLVEMWPEDALPDDPDAEPPCEAA